MRSAVVLGLALAFALLVSAGPAAAHGNHLSVDDQYTENGTVVVETVFASLDGFVVIHADDGGEPGRPLGHAAIDTGITTGARVPIGEEWSARDGPQRVWAVLHGDDGDGSFEPGRDEALPNFGGEAEREFTVETRAAGPASVVANDIDSQATTGTVTVGRVALGTDGALVVRADRNGEPGRVVGRTPLAAGVHEDVAVDLDDSYYRQQDARFGLWATLEENGAPVRLDGAPVASEFGVRKTERTNGTTAVGADGPPDVTREDTDRSRADSVGDGPGFGVLAAALAFVVVVFARGRSRRG